MATKEFKMVSSGEEKITVSPGKSALIIECNGIAGMVSATALASLLKSDYVIVPRQHIKKAKLNRILEVKSVCRVAEGA